MKLMSCTLMGFGKLYRRAYTFSDGINVIYGENESGKTTLRTFLTGMLFGLERKRGIASKKDEFHKYQPCNGGIYGGTLSVSTGDQVYQIQRNFTDVSDITVYNEKTGKKILSGTELTGKLFSMTREAYLQTLCISQGEIRTDQSLGKMLNHYLTNMSQTKSREVNVDRAVSYLRKEMRKLKRDPILKELEDIRNQISRQHDRKEELRQFQDQREILQRRIDGLQTRQSWWEKIKNWIRKLLGLADQKQLERQRLEYERDILGYKIEQIEKEQEFNEELRIRYANIKEKQTRIEYNKKSIEDAVRAILEASEEIHEEFGSGFQDKVSSIMKIIIIGGVAAGAKAAAKSKRGGVGWGALHLERSAGMEYFPALAGKTCKERDKRRPCAQREEKMDRGGCLPCGNPAGRDDRDAGSRRTVRDCCKRL